MCVFVFVSRHIRLPCNEEVGLTGFVQVTENLEKSWNFFISRPEKLWDLSEGHGKVICVRKIERPKDKKKLEITDESETGFNFSRNRHKHTSHAFFTGGSEPYLQNFFKLCQKLRLIMFIKI